MDNFCITPFIQNLQALPAEIVSLILLFACIATLLLLLKYFAEQGLYIYCIVAVLASNIQVLQNVQFSFSEKPLAMGTILFSTTYLCSDILTEHFGNTTAKRGVWYCFIAQLLMTLFMIIAVGHPPLSSTAVGLGDIATMGDIVDLNSQNAMFGFAEKAIAFLFTPSPRLLFASLLAFVISQFSDIAIFQAFSKLTRQRYLWVRTLGSTLISALIDTALFSTLAWVILSPKPVDLKTLVITYILGSMVARAIVAVISTPVLYSSYYFLPKKSFYATES